MIRSTTECLRESGDHEETKRLFSLDLLRLIACYAVVLLHMCAPFLGMRINSRPSLWWAANTGMTLVAWCVPVFILISGAVMIGRTAGTNPGDFYRRRAAFFWRVLFWTLVFMLMKFWLEPDLTLPRALKDLGRGIPFYHLWFLFMISGLYLVTPFLDRFCARTGQPGRLLAVCLILSAASIITILRDNFEPRIRQTILTLFIPFTGYYLFGHELRKIEISRIKAPIFLLLIVLSSFLILFTAYAGATRRLEGFPHTWLFGAFSPAVIVLSVSVFLLGARIGPVVEKLTLAGKAVKELAPATFGIYVLHPFFIIVAESLCLPQMVANPLSSFVFTATIVFLWTTLTVWVLIKIPYLRRLLL